MPRGARPAHVVFVLAALVFGVGWVALYLVEPDREWIKLWAPSIGGALLVGAITVFAVNIAVEAAEERRRESLRRAARRELHDIRTAVDQFLGKWQEAVWKVSGDFLEVLKEEEDSTAPFPQALIEWLPTETNELLWVGWGQPNHEKIQSTEDWQAAVETVKRIRLQSEQMVGWYAEALDAETLDALAELLQYVGAVVQNIPRRGDANWFMQEEPGSRFLLAYKKLWPQVDDALDSERKRHRGTLRTIYSPVDLTEGDIQHTGRTYAYVNPVLVSLHDALHPEGGCERAYLELITSSRAALDLGCGTGRLLKKAASSLEFGSLYPHQRTFVGVDRESPMLAGTRGADRISWGESLIDWEWNDARVVDVGRWFDLVLMTGGAFQELLTDDDVRMVLSNALHHLDPGGRFAFDLRPRDWYSTPRSAPASPGEGGGGSRGEVAAETTALRTPETDLIEFKTTYMIPEAVEPITSYNVIRFIDHDKLRAMLGEAGFRVDCWFGDWSVSSPPQHTYQELVVATYAPRPDLRA